MSSPFNPDDTEKLTDDNAEFIKTDDNAEFDKLVQDAAQQNALSSKEKAALDSAIKSTSAVKWIADKLPAYPTDAIRKKRQVAFLRNFAVCGNISKACREIGINAVTQRNWHKEPWYAAQFKDAYQMYLDRLEEEVHDRAVEGTDVPIVGKVQTPFGAEDRIIGSKKVKSDILLMFHAKRHIPEYREDYKKPDETMAIDSNSPMTRITVRLDTIAARQRIALPLGEKSIDVLPPSSSVEDTAGEGTGDIIEIESSE